MTNLHYLLSAFHRRPILCRIPPQISSENLLFMLQSPLLSTWMHRLSLNSRDTLDTLEFQSVDFFGPKRLGFIKMKVHTEKNPAGFIVVLRGGTVAMLIQLRCEGRIYIPLVQMTSIPIGFSWFPSLPAGMAESTDGSVQNVALREIKEETGIESLITSDLVDLITLLYGSEEKESAIQEKLSHEVFGEASSRKQLQGMYPSVGILDEYIKLMMSKPIDIGRKQLDTLQHQEHGNREENEYIRLLVVPIEEAFRYSTDMKLLSALFLREKAIAAGVLPKEFL